MLNNVLFQIHVLQLWRFQFWCGLGEELRTFEVIIPCQNTYLYEAGFSVMTIKQNIDLSWFPRMTWDYLFDPQFPESQILCVEIKHKSVSDWLVEIACHFSKKEKFKTWLCIPSFKLFTPWLSDMPLSMKLFLEFQQHQRTIS